MAKIVSLARLQRKSEKMAKTTKRAATKKAKSAKAKDAPVSIAAPTQPPQPGVVKITAAKGRPMLTWVGKRPLAQVTAFPAQHIEGYVASQPAMI
jgi:hypothetical protein